MVLSLTGDSEPKNSLEFYEVADFEHLYESMFKCTRGVVWKDSVANFLLNGIECTLKLESELYRGKYRQRKPKKFTITSPKKRDIVSVSFRDRVFQRSLNDNSIYPKMSKSFIYDNSACQKKKGTDFARNRLKCFLQKYYRKYGPNGYILISDIKGYYPNMSHKYVKRCFRRKLDTWSYQQAKTVLDCQYDGEVGYNPGSQMIQIAGLALLDELDHCIKEKLKVKYYLRYMDDLILIHKDEQFLKDRLWYIALMALRKNCRLHEKKTRIIKISDGVSFLGFTFKLTDTGRVLMFINPENVKRERKKLSKMVALCKAGEISKSKVDECFTSWLAHAKQGDSRRLIVNMRQYYKSLWKE